MTPTNRILATADERFSTTDQLGRMITARRLSALDKLRLLKAAGPVLSDNQAWLGVAMLAASVIDIDSVPVPMPTTEQQIEGIVAKLGDLGLDAIAGMLADADPTMEPNVGNSPSTLT